MNYNHFFNIKKIIQFKSNNKYKKCILYINKINSLLTL